MKRAPADRPNLDDVLARDFAELKVGEANITTEETTAVEKKTAPEVAQAPSTPKVYNQRIDAVEDREAFVVRAPASEAPAEKTERPERTVLKAPSTQPGDDFDVDW